MRLLIGIIVIVYLVGVGVCLSPTFREKWSSAPTSELVASVEQAVPSALAWPARIYHNMAGREAPV